MTTSKDKKEICDKIISLSKTEHNEVFKILNELSYNFTQNSNGIFFNFSLVKDEDVAKIKSFVDFCYENKKKLDEYDIKYNECKVQNNYEKNSCQQDEEKQSVTLDKVFKKKNELLVSEAVAMFPRVQNLMNVLESRNDSLFTKIYNSKFVNAKKKYSKKFYSDKKTDYDIHNDLEEEPYTYIQI